jgi:hypothetical protein
MRGESAVRSSTQAFATTHCQSKTAQRWVKLDSDIDPSSTCLGMP